ncbi:MAG: alpha/beta hydrolase [Solirubrobacteraceae bacterium]|nr:alpha/beta hydrolase [Solirubrobacteraceae bacterium]
MRVEPEHHGGSGTPLLLLHGFTDTWYAWRPLLPYLEPEHEVLAVTLPGHHGGPDLGGRPMTVETALDILEARLDAAGWATAHIAGSSYGGWLSLGLAARGRARSVVALCPAGGWKGESPEGRHVYRYFLRSHHILKRSTPRMLHLLAVRPRLRAAAFREVIAHPRRLPPGAALHMLEGARECSVVLEGIEAARREDAFGALGPIDVPVRIAYGERDWLIRWPRWYERLRRMLPDAEYVKLADCGHLPMWDDPELTARTILEVTRARDADRSPAAAD